MPNPKKITKGIYYSCPHQKLGNSKCNTCNGERERERERERQELQTKKN